MFSSSWGSSRGPRALQPHLTRHRADGHLQPVASLWEALTGPAERRVSAGAVLANQVPQKGGIPEKRSQHWLKLRNSSCSNYCFGGKRGVLQRGVPVRNLQTAGRPDVLGQLPASIRVRAPLGEESQLQGLLV